MRKLVGGTVPLVVAAITGVLVLGGYLLPSIEVLAAARALILDWAIIVAGFALLLGLANVVRAHGRRIVVQDRGWSYSAVLLLAALVAWVPGILPVPEVKDAVFRYILGPLGASLAALVLFALVLAAVRMLRVRPSAEVPVFLLVAGIVLLGSTPLSGSGWFAGFRDWLVRIPATAGLRGLLLGVGIGVAVTGLRLIVGGERPWSESHREKADLTAADGTQASESGQADG
jgi:hypothetical protein